MTWSCTTAAGPPTRSPSRSASWSPPRARDASALLLRRQPLGDHALQVGEAGHVQRADLALELLHEVRVGEGLLAGLQQHGARAGEVVLALLAGLHAEQHARRAAEEAAHPARVVVV